MTMRVDNHVCGGKKTENRADVLQKLCDTYGVHDIYAFGSRAGEMLAWLKGDSVQSAHPDSDVDIGILPLRSAKWDAERKVSFSMELTHFFAVSRVDLVLLPFKKERIRMILEEGGR